MERREFLRLSGLGVGLAAVSSTTWATAHANSTSKRAAAFTLPKLPYAYDALEPVIDTETMTIHHTKHHQAYVDNLNKALAGQDAWQSVSLDDLMKRINQLPEAIIPAVRNNGGGHWNHDFFWKIMKPQGGTPGGQLLKDIHESFGNLEAFQKSFIAAAGARFGSGWVWLIPGKTKPLEIISTPNQDNPLMGPEGVYPVLGCDLWEHAYYLKYRNLRAAYVEAWLKVLDWGTLSDRYQRG